MRLALAALAALLATAATAADFTPSAAAMKGHIGFLASDLMEGREAGTRGYDLAASYVATRFEMLGLKPAGDAGSYLQTVPLATYRPADGGTIRLTARDGTVTELKVGTDYTPGTTPLAANVRLDAPLVFVGFGVVAPKEKRDDYRGLDVRGKIVVALSGAPKFIQGEERAHYANTRTKRAEAAKRGAIGLITLYTPTQEKRAPFARTARNWRSLSMTWVDAAGKPSFVGAAATPVATVGLGGAEKLLAGAPVPVAAIMAAAEDPKGRVPRFQLPARAEVRLTNELGTATSSNVAALVEGADPALKAEVVVLSAHLDHVGIGPEVNGDRINNGALDNASGIATLLEVARGFAGSATKPKRSVLLLAVTAEEKGLIGSDYFIQNPTVAPRAIVANVNLDMPILTYPFIDVIAFGGDRSSIGPAVRRAADAMQLGVTPDPTPDEGIFTRSDHYRFVEQGVPAVFLKTGPGNGGADADRLFRAEHYHRPSDDLSQPIDYDAAARFADLNYRIARELADTPARPAWNRGDFFGTLFGK